MNFCALRLGPVFGLGILSLAAFACSGSTFSAERAPEPDPQRPDTADSVIGGAAAAAPGKPSTADGGTPSTADGGAPEAEPQQLPGGSHAGGGGAGGNHAGGSGGSAGSAIAGTGGNSNIPDPPVDPSCAAPLAEDWTHPIGTSSNWEVQFGDPWIDVANHRLVVTHDDVAARTTAFDGGYYVAAEVTLEGGTVLTPYPYSNEMRWPSLRRTSTGSNVELGGAKYGSSELWTSNDWPGFSGTIIAGTTSVSVTTYVKATAKALAIKVSSGAQTYRSGWVSGFTWPQTNLGIMRYVGENNSSVHAGDAVYVGPLRGCQKLGDAAIDALFKN